MVYQTSFNPAIPSVMHIDINSAFATIEQQANPLLRDVPLAVASSSKSFGCILAASREAKLWKIKTGMSVQEGKERCPFLVVRQADPAKYRHIHQEIRSILDTYSDQVIPKSIDEFVIHFSNSPASLTTQTGTILAGQALEIQNKIKNQVGSWITVSIGISTNRLLAKLGSDLKYAMPFIIDKHNYLKVYQELKPMDFSGISNRLFSRLKNQGISSALDFFHATPNQLKSAFRSRLSHDWYLHLRGWETNTTPSVRRSFGQSYVLPHPMESSEWSPILAKLIHKATRRMRSAGYSTHILSLNIRYANDLSYHQRYTSPNSLVHTHEIIARFQSLTPKNNNKVKKIAITLGGLDSLNSYQCSLTENTPRTHALTTAVDHVNSRFGTYTLHSASMLGSGSN